jgi:porphobilinogen synthase
LKDKVPDLLVWTDVCLCSYTDHGHCGLVDAHGTVLNDESLPALAATALAHAAAGADAVAPSDMMDGRIGHIREKLDSEGYDHVPVVSYAAKFASAFYGPFRDAAHSAPAFGDRRSYQMDSANSREALEEIAQDIDEGADIVMVKPALAYLDVIRMARDTFSLPIAAYQVSGEYSMIKATAERGWIGEREIALETLLSIKRAGADIILTYFAKEAARWLNQ